MIAAQNCSSIKVHLLILFCKLRKVCVYVDDHPCDLALGTIEGLDFVTPSEN